ncbi:MAG TPA: Hpt domain-containing protein [Flavobacteriales bacterium]|nr:Hpt domain-containing protein [Flavobacteriales bacterium]
MIPNSAGRVSNLDFLTTHSNGNPGFIKEMVTIFMEESAAAMLQVERGIKGHEYDAIRRGAHILKAITVYVGVDRFIKRDVMEMERLAIAETDLTRIEQLYLKVREIWLKAVEELKIV